MNYAPCSNCQDRNAECHSNCDIYLNWKAEHDERQRKIKEETNSKYGYHHSFLYEFSSPSAREFFRKKNNMPGQY